MAARAVRETIFTVLPVWFRDQAEDLANRTLRGEGSGKTLDQRKADAIAHFESAWNVTREQLETRLTRPSGKWTEQDIGFLQVLHGEMSRGEKRADDEFPAPARGITVTNVTPEDAFPETSEAGQ